MSTNDIYCDIAKRTDGDIYIGVVGPVRTGKSTFIKKFMESLVIPNIASEYRRERAVDELPQSAAGKTIMTTEPKFIPEEAVEVTIGDKARFNARMIDCVGYIVPSAIGYIENEAPRMVITPWFEDEVPFAMAAEVGTRKVIQDHSTIGLVITTDGSISDIPREEYEEAEQRVINELNSINKPFVVLLNCVYPNSKESAQLAAELSEKYGTPVIPVNCVDLEEDDINYILKQVLYAFPIKEINICMPKWITGLAKGHWLKNNVFDTIRSAAENVRFVRDINSVAESIADNENISRAAVSEIDLGKGSAEIYAELKSNLFFKVLGEETGIEISGESDLMPLLKDLTAVKAKYEKIENALSEVDATGYGIVMPTIDELSLEEPEIVKQGGKYGVRLKASAPSIHMMKADIVTEVSPIVGSEKQSEELVMYLLKEFEESPQKIWESNIFGKSLHELVNEGLHNKLYRMPVDARMKLQETLERIINEGCGGLICFIL
ncbi:MAG: stage IV sporulation protein A [Ruminococcus sp.]|nr:stage IV sporulation protein A [Ruminococcus sp.]MDE5578236.1 stage IV sporulation protein A [Oscillospiraceae bacterium]